MTEMSFRSHSAALAAVTELFQEKVKELKLSSLRRLASALQEPQTGAEDIVHAVETAASDGPPARVLKGSGLGELVPRDAGDAAIEALAVDVDDKDWALSELLGAGETAERIGVARTSLDNWRRAHKVIAFRKGVRNFLYPVRQFERRGPVEGIDRVRAQFEDDGVAWEWLVAANPATGDLAPIDWLRKGKVDDVVRAAEGAFDYQ